MPSSPNFAALLRDGFTYPILHRRGWAQSCGVVCPLLWGEITTVGPSNCLPVYSSITDRAERFRDSAVWRLHIHCEVIKAYETTSLKVSKGIIPILLRPSFHCLIVARDFSQYTPQRSSTRLSNGYVLPRPTECSFCCCA